MICFYGKDRHPRTDSILGRRRVGFGVTCHCNSATKHPNQKGQGYVIYSKAYQITLSSSLGGMHMHDPYLFPFDLISGMIGILVGLRYCFGISDTIDYR